VHPPSSAAARLAQSGEKPLPVFVIVENILRPVAAVHHMVDRARVFETRLARHAVTSAVSGLDLASQKAQSKA